MSYGILDEPIHGGRLAELGDTVLIAPAQRPTHTPDGTPFFPMLQKGGVSKNTTFEQKNIKKREEEMKLCSRA